jgi:hypothetical protein
MILAFDAAIWLLPRGESFEPPQLFPLRIAVPMLIAAPGVLALIAAATGRRSVAVAAGVLCLLQSVIAFSGVTLVFLIPAVTILWNAGDGDGALAERSPLDVRRVLLALAVAIPLVYATIATIGFLAPVLLVLVAGVVRLARRGRPVAGSAERASINLWPAARAAAIVVLVVAAWAAILSRTETVCWLAREGPGGSLVWEQVPPTSEISLGEGEVGETCSSGQPTPAALSMAAVLLGAAFLGAALPRARRPTDPA